MLSLVGLYARSLSAPALCAPRQLHVSSRLAYTPSIQRLAGPVGIRREGVEDAGAVEGEVKSKCDPQRAVTADETCLTPSPSSQPPAKSTPSETDEILALLQESQKELDELHAGWKELEPFLRQSRAEVEAKLRRGGLVVAVECTTRLLLDHANASDLRIRLPQEDIEGVVNAADWYDFWENLQDGTLEHHLRNEIRPLPARRRRSSAHSARLRNLVSAIMSPAARHLVLLATEHLIPAVWSADDYTLKNYLDRNHVESIYETVVRPGVEDVLASEPEKVEGLLAQLRPALDSYINFLRKWEVL